MKSSLVLIGSVVLAIAFVVVAFVFLKPEEEVSLPLQMQEYIDYNCIHCLEYWETSEKLREDFGDELEVEVIVNPILGNSSFQAAYAAEAAREQGQFLEYSDLLYENFEKRTDEDYVNFAKELDLDIEKFNADRESEEIQNRVADIRAENEELGVNSTPTLFINGRQVSSRDYEELKELIAEKIELAKQQAEENNSEEAVE